MKWSLSDWRKMMNDWFDGAEHEMVPADQTKWAAEFAAFRSLLKSGRTIRNRRKLEREIEAFFESDEILKAALWTHLGKRAAKELARAEVVLRNANRILARYEKDVSAKRALKPRRPSAKAYIN